MSTVRILRSESEYYILYPFRCEQMDQRPRILCGQRRLSENESRLTSQNEQLLNRISEIL